MIENMNKGYLFKFVNGDSCVATATLDLPELAQSLAESKFIVMSETIVNVAQIVWVRKHDGAPI